MKYVVNFGIVCIGVYLLGSFLANNGSTIAPVKVHASACRVSLAGYSGLTTGIGYADAVRILGCPGQEMSRSEIAGFTTVMVGWDGSGMLGANMNAMFQNGGLVNKAQMGLR